MFPPIRVIRPNTIIQSGSICSRCLRQLSPPATASRSLATSPTSREATTVSSRQTPRSLRKEYFWANSALEQVVKGARRRAWSAVVPGKTLGATERASQSSTSLRPATEEAPSTPQSTSLEKEELPHRRRKRLKKEAAAAAAAAESGTSAEPVIPPDASSLLSTLSSRLPTHSIRRFLATYLSLSKPRLTFMIVLTATAAYALYPVPALLSPSTTAAPSLSTATLVFLTTGTALASASANALNMLAEPAHDAKMSRTRNRPLVRGLVGPAGALAFAVATGVAGVVALYLGVNPTTAALGAANIVLYAGVYTPLKRVSVLNTWIGAVVGGIPPLMGWTAAAGQYATGGSEYGGSGGDGGEAAAPWWRSSELLFGQDAAGGWLLAALLFAWQFPHFNALSYTIRDEYRNAGYRMLAWTNPARNARVALRYALLMVPICVGFGLAGVTDWGFVATSAAPNAWLVAQAGRFWYYGGTKGSARGLFWASVWHLPIVLVMAMAWKKGMWERVWRAAWGDREEDADDWEEDEGDEG
ncbi:protoheme IX farnesyltransferase [Lineolata rhizophorae]|uniref:Protoheme IX farnesyltransferase, mitochondrial n=1 Tax=Lineolata rhizophorae TaxID=578093 RepID=A0A6A6NR40_9PEZI|nr:protoheme IX farnesyltransferase [Lineolata rhizophorae]